MDLRESGVVDVGELMERAEPSRHGGGIVNEQLSQIATETD